VTRVLGSGPRRPLPRVPLRITLVALLVALVAAALVATGFAATSLLKGYLQGQLDSELRSAVRVAEGNPQYLQACVGAQYRRALSQTYYGCVPPGEDDLVALQGPPHGGELPDVDADRLLDEAMDHPVTVPSEDHRSEWRVMAAPLQDGYMVVVGTQSDRDKAAIARLVAIEIVVGLIVLALLGTAGWVLVGNSLRPLREVESTARAIAAGDLSQRVPAGDERTEVGRLSTALNGMLSRIESAFRSQQASEEQARASESRMRRFVADASHELRTPLTSIRGFAELYRQGAVRTPEETGRLLQRIESEGARMGLLVEDLLQLARMDQQRPLTVTPVDLAEVAGDAVHDARLLQPDRPLELRLDDRLSEVPVVLGDEARLRQVVGNLVTNALVHTPGDARVTVTVSDEPAPVGGPGDEMAEDGGVVVLEVADDGPGMAPEDAARVFERFYRADPSRTRAAGGTGLGLAIVASLVEAHGGTVHLDTAPGAGARFTVRLPRSGPPAPPPDGGAPG
jgi:signal transduction histidine kinase